MPKYVVTQTAYEKKSLFFWIFQQHVVTQTAYNLYIYICLSTDSITKILNDPRSYEYNLCIKPSNVAVCIVYHSQSLVICELFGRMLLNISLVSLIPFFVFFDFSDF